MMAETGPVFLIEPDALEREIALGDALVIDARKRPEYDNSHIPDALHLSTYSCFVPDTTAGGMSAFASDMASRHGAVGASRGRPIVVYEKDTGMRAARALWILEYLGHRDARMLHGGLDAWLTNMRDADTYYALRSRGKRGRTLLPSRRTLCFRTR